MNEKIVEQIERLVANQNENHSRHGEDQKIKHVAVVVDCGFFMVVELYHGVDCDGQKIFTTWIVNDYEYLVTRTESYNAVLSVDDGRIVDDKNYQWYMHRNFCVADRHEYESDLIDDLNNKGFSTMGPETLDQTLARKTSELKLLGTHRDLVLFDSTP